MCAYSYDTSSAHRKLALVIGNSHYESGANLRNCVNDADDMTGVLQSIGFQVTKGINLTCDQMDSYVDNFARQIQPSDMAVFHFSGHGKQFGDQNWLVASDDRSPNIQRSAINAQTVLNKISGRGPWVSVFLLDCCRNYPSRNLERGVEPEGLRPMTANAGTIIAFACAPDAVASDGSERNGLFTKHLLLNITRPNEEIQDLLIDVTKDVLRESRRKQVPWQNSCLTERNICLVEKGSGGDVAQMSPEERRMKEWLDQYGSNGRNVIIFRNGTAAVISEWDEELHEYVGDHPYNIYVGARGYWENCDNDNWETWGVAGAYEKDGKCVTFK